MPLDPNVIANSNLSRFHCQNEEFSERHLWRKIPFPTATSNNPRHWRQRNTSKRWTLRWLDFLERGNHDFETYPLYICGMHQWHTDSDSGFFSGAKLIKTPLRRTREDFLPLILQLNWPQRTAVLISASAVHHRVVVVLVVKYMLHDAACILRETTTWQNIW